MKKAGDLLGAFFDDGLMRSASGYSELFSSWKRIVGDHIASHSKIVELEKTILVVEADHPGWIQLIQMKRASILDSVRKQFPDLTVTAISIKLTKATSLPSVGHAERPIERVEMIESCKQETGRDPYASISDESFKNILKRLEQSIKKGSR